MKILITGASRGIGFFLMQKFLSDGLQVFGTYNLTIPSVDFKKHLTKVDISDHDQVVNWVSSVVSAEDKIVGINCAGTNYNAVAHKSDIQKWKKVIDVNLLGSFYMTNALLPYMREKGFGRIINFSSVVAQKGIPGTSAYAASKAALWGMTKSIAAENARKGITINNLNLGYFDIGMIKEIPVEILDGIKKNIPIYGLGNPDNIFNAVSFLINSNYITGSSLDINGGLF